jgi:UDP-N-acetylglucosamine--N-acetylmuramyl-(pentapeptide) pyrophosphoryl-undecaprenol N-acetylglucosamine transferase
MAWAAERRKLPLVLLEQNIVPGRATRWLASSADVVCLPWPEARKNLPRSINVQITGNPVRSEFVNCGRTSAGSQTRPIGSQTRPSLENQGIAKIQSLATSATAGIADRKTRRLVIFGGSQGARQLNEEVPKALYKLHGMLAGWEIIHQSGEAACAATKRRYDNLQVPACVVPFVHHPATVLRKADLVICRAGGTTLAELTAVGVPAILIPYRHSAGDHQRHNAEFFARSGAAVVIDTCQRHRRTDNLLVQALQTPLSNDERRESMRRAMRRLARADAAMHVSDAILSLLRLERVNRAA